MNKSNILRMVVVWLIGMAAININAQVPGIISHQGKIMVNGTNFTGSGQFEFALVDVGGTNTFWSNDGSSVGGSEPSTAVTLPVSRGIFSVNLGDTNVANMTQAIAANIMTNHAVYLRVWFNDGANGFQLFTPDQQLTAVPYAMDAAYYAETDPVFSASAAAGISSNQVTQWNTAYSWGNPATNGYITETAADARYLQSYTETDPIFTASAAAGIQTSDITNWNGKLDGRGTAGYLPVYAASTSLSNSPVFVSSGNIGVGTNTPGTKLDVLGKIHSSTGGFVFPDGTVQTTAATNTTSSGGGGSSTVLVEAFLSSDVSLTSSALTQISFNNAVVNVGGALSSGSFTVPATGNYTVQCAIASANSPGHTKAAVIFNNGSAFYMGSAVSGLTATTGISDGYVANVVYTGPLTAGNVLTFYAAMNAGTGVTAASGQSFLKTSLLITKLP